MKVIFLDVDGVLNSKNNTLNVYQLIKRPMSGFNYPFDEKCLCNLKRLLEVTDSFL